MALFEREPGATLDEVAAEAARGPLPETPAAPAAKSRKKHPGRQTLPADPPRVVKQGLAVVVAGDANGEKPRTHLTFPPHFFDELRTEGSGGEMTARARRRVRRGE